RVRGRLTCRRRPACGQDADIAAAQNVSLQSNDGKVRRNRTCRQFVVRLDVQRSDAEFADGARDPAASNNGYGLALTQADPPAEKQNGDVVAVAATAVSAEVEYALPLEEKIPLLRKLEGETREVDLLDVFLDLRKVGVDRGVGNEATRQ